MGIIKIKNSNENVVSSETTEIANGVVAEAQPDATVERGQSKTWDNPAVLYEKEDEANENSRHYVLNNGTKKSIFSAEAVNYFDEETKKWENIDNTLVETDDSFESKKGKVRTKISKAGKGKKVKVSKADKSLSWEFLGKQHINPAIPQLAKEKETTLKVDAILQGKRKNVNSRAKYEDADRATDLEYCLHGNNLKENIIVREPSDSYRYLFALNTEGLKLRLSANNNNLELYSEKQKEDNTIEEIVEFTIPSPYMYDANGMASDDVYYELEPAENGRYMFAVIASDEWINAEERAFPITIDPQVITSANNLITYKTYYRSINTTSSAGTVYSAWYTTSSSNIKVSKTSTMEYKTILTIDRSLLNLSSNRIASAKLCLTPIGTFNSYYLYCNGTRVYCNPVNGVSYIDITSSIRNNTGKFEVALTPYSTVTMQFYATGNPPALEIEYLTNDGTRPTKRNFSLAGFATGDIDLSTGDMVTSFCDVSADNSVGGVAISHIYKKSAEDYLLGDNFRLNIHETLTKNGDSALDANYIYTDARGDKHAFRDYYYYISTSGKKVYVPTSSKSSIVASPDGTLKYSNNLVYCEYKSATGLKAMTQLDGLKYVSHLDQRSDELKQVDQKANGYGNTLKEFVAVNKSDGSIVYRLKSYISSPSSFESFLSYANVSTRILLTEGEALAYKSLILQKEALQYQATSLTLQRSSLEYSIESMENQINSMNNAVFVPENYKDECVQEEINLAVSNNLCFQIGHANDQDGNIVNIAANNTKQITAITNQITAYNNKKTQYLDQIKEYYREYYAAQTEQKKLKQQLPVNFLTNEKIIKGYNENGELVGLFDRYGNEVVVEYEKYIDAGVEKTRICRLYDNKDKQVVLEYTPNNLLSSITDVHGSRVDYDYDSQSRLNHVKYDSGVDVEFTYDAEGNILTIKENKAQKVCSLTRIDCTSTISLSILNESMVDVVKAPDILMGAAYNIGYISKYDVSFTKNTSGTMHNVIIATDNVREKYVFDSSENLVNYFLEEDCVVTKAEQYEYQSYWKGNVAQSSPRDVVIQAKRSTLGKYTIASYNFVAGDNVVTTLDQFENPITSTSETVINSDGTVKEIITTAYIYDENQRLIGEDATITYDGTDKTFVAHKKYQYNSSGALVKTESYIEGEELTSGKTIEETVYDKKGNVVKRFTYNSLDSGSKFYTESEYAEDGKLSAKFDQTGKNKTAFVYKDGTNVVREEVLPNGSSFAYGHDSDNSVTTITQSTEELEENFTQKLYNCGELVELNSGNTNVRYSYYSDRRLRSIDLYGEHEYHTYEYMKVNDSACSQLDEIIINRVNSWIIEYGKDRRGNLLSLSVEGLFQFEKEYEKGYNLKILRDRVTGKSYEYERDDLDRVITVNELNSSGSISEGGYGEVIEYDDYGAIGMRRLTGPVAQVYDYTYTEDSKRRLVNLNIGSVTVKPKYDVLGRNKGRELAYGSGSNNKVAEERISYLKAGDHATNLPGTIWFGNKVNGTYRVSDSLRYAYDNMGNIEKIYENGELAVRYQYDALGRLTREDNKVLDKTTLFVYDNNGNILKQRQFAFTLKDNTLIEELDSTDKVYIYEGDKLISYNGQSCVYDRFFNPTTYRGKAATWSLLRQLTSYNGHTFTYDGLGRRWSKDNIAYTYDADNRLIKQGDGLEFFYDHTGVAGVIYNNATYLYRKDALGNIIALINSSGNVVARYVYDAWGNHKVINTSGVEITDSSNIANLNPFRYRSYYYDRETKLYYLKSRYYDPEVGRFITIDDVAYLDPGAINGLNLYAYCRNNPVMYADPNGHFALLALAALLLFTPIGGVVAQAVTSAVGYVGAAAVAGVDYLINGTDGSYYQDMNSIGWNPFNSSVEPVLASTHFSFFKGAPVFRISKADWNNGRSFSVGAIFLIKNETEDALLHERGHNSQLMMMGIGTYAFSVAIPSAFVLGKWANIDRKYYYSPWEAMADHLGGVTTRYEMPIPQEHVDRAWEYYRLSMFALPFTMAYWFY